MRFPGFLVALFLSAGTALAHPSADDHQAVATYIANEGVLVTDGDTKILFDPLFQTSYDVYRTPSEAQREAMLNGEAPFDGVEAIFISHAHGDHFTAEDVNAYLAAQESVRLVAPREAIKMLETADNWNDGFATRLLPLDLKYKDEAVTLKVGEEIEVVAVYVPHSGWPEDGGVENIVYRVTTGGNATVMHMGDADDNDVHFAPHDQVWRDRQTDLAFPPFWFFRSPESRALLSERLNIARSVGVHVPLSPPERLVTLREENLVDYFTEPGEIRIIETNKSAEQSDE